MIRLRTSLALAAGGALFLMMRRERGRVERLAAAALESLLNAIDANDSQTGGHVRRVARYALILADAYHVEKRQRAGVERVALFHDIGKIQEALFDVTHDTSSLSRDERRLIATHPQRGAEVLAPLSFFYPDLGEGVLAHHERWDGRGYPRRLRGREIPLAARIVSIADTFDAITHQRRYGRPRSLNSAASVFRAERGRQFDPDLVDLFLSKPVFQQIERSFHARRLPHHGRARDGWPGTRGETSRDRVGRAGRAVGEPPAPSAPDVPFRWRSKPRT